MRRTRASTATGVTAAAPQPSSRSTHTEVVTVEDDDGVQVIDVPVELLTDDSQKENVPVSSSTTSATQYTGLFDKYRHPSASAPDSASGTVTKRNVEVLPFVSKKRARTTKHSTPSTAATADTATSATASTSASAASPAAITFAPNMRHRSLAPLLPNPSLGHPPPTVLIVGSAPSEASLKAQNYYAFKYNHFWPITSRLFHFDLALPYQQRVDALTSRGVAVWDVCREFSRKGSLDSNLRGVVANDFVTLFDAHPTIRLIASNGGTSFALFRRLIGLAEVERRGMVHVQLPSSSPAHAMKNAVEEKTKRWKAALQVGDRGELLVGKQGAKAEQAVDEAEQGDLVELED